MNPLASVVRRPLTAAALGYLGMLILGSSLAPVIAPYPPNATDLNHVLSGPTTTHPLGTDGLGRDVLTRLLYGGRVSLVDAATVVLTVLVVGVSSGVAAGYAGGRVDRLFTQIVDVLLAIPVIVTLLAVLAVVGDHEIAAMIALGMLLSPGPARVVRGIALAVRREPYVAAARVCGLPTWRIVTGHVLIGLAGPIIIQTSLLAGGALLVDAGLSYLGLGAQPPTATWGGMIADGAAVIDRQPWLLVPPGIVLGLGILAFGLLGDAARDTPTPRAPRTPRVRLRAAPIPRPPSENPALLSLREVTVALGTTTVVEHIDLEVHAGETVGLVGESGCGKTMTGRAILGLLPPGGAVTGGTIVFDQTDLTEPGAVCELRGSRIAMIFQDPFAGLDPMFTAGAQLGELVRRHHGGSRRAARARALELLRSVDFTDPEAIVRRYPHELSGGMAQRIGTAMALAGEPDLLIADEPTTALDATVRAEVLGLLRRLQAERGMAILLISHDWTVISGMCRRAYVMYAGHIVESGAIPGMLQHPRHPYTAGLLAAAPGRARTRHLAAIPGTVPDPQAWPPGCHFAPRCALATADCSAAPIPLLEPVPDHRTRCIHHQGDGRDRSPVGPP